MAGNDTDQLAPGRQSPESRSRRWRIVRRLVIATVIVLVLFYGGLGWVFSSKIQNDAFAVHHPDPPTDPRAEHGLEYEETTYPSELGAMPAWHVPGRTDTWVILVHGKGASRGEALRVLPPLAENGYHAFVVSYRNDRGAPQDPSGEYGYGATEWRDVEAAVVHAKNAGAQRLALVGYSMGGGIVVSFALNSDLADEIDAIVLDAPMLDLAAAIDLGADDSSLPIIGLPVPGSLTAVAKRLAQWRFDIHWQQFDYLAAADELEIPMLVYHGTEDTRVPLETSEQLASLRPDLVTLEVFDGAGHVKSWNMDAQRYEETLIGFLDRLVG